MKLIGNHPSDRQFHSVSLPTSFPSWKLRRRPNVEGDYFILDEVINWYLTGEFEREDGLPADRDTYPSPRAAGPRTAPLFLRRVQV